MKIPPIQRHLDAATKDRKENQRLRKQNKHLKITLGITGIAFGSMLLGMALFLYRVF